MPEAEGIGRGGVCVRASGGSGETGLAPEASGGRARRCLRPSPRGSGVPCFELEIEEVDGWGPRPGDPGGLILPFAIFYRSDLGIPFYGTQQ